MHFSDSSIARRFSVCFYIYIYMYNIYLGVYIYLYICIYIFRDRDPQGDLFNNSSVITFSHFPSLHYCFWHISFQGLKVHESFLQEL